MVEKKAEALGSFLKGLIEDKKKVDDEAEKDWIKNLQNTTRQDDGPRDSSHGAVQQTQIDLTKENNSKAYKRMGTAVSFAYEMAQRKKEVEAPLSNGLTDDIIDEISQAKKQLQKMIL